MRLNSKSQVTIPAPVRTKHRLYESDVVEEGDDLRIVRVAAGSTRGERLVRAMRGRATTPMITDQLLGLLRDE